MADEKKKDGTDEVMGPELPVGMSGVEAMEGEPATPADLHSFLALVRKWNPDEPLGRQVEIARHMLDRHPFIDRAYRDGLMLARDLRERARYKLGWWWPSLQPLTPRERGFVVARVRAAIEPKGVM